MLWCSLLLLNIAAHSGSRPWRGLWRLWRSQKQSRRSCEDPEIPHEALFPPFFATWIWCKMVLACSRQSEKPGINAFWIDVSIRWFLSRHPDSLWATILKKICISCLCRISPGVFQGLLLTLRNFHSSPSWRGPSQIWRDLCKSLLLSAFSSCVSLPSSRLSPVSQACSGGLTATGLCLLSPPLWPSVIASSAAFSLWLGDQFPSTS